MAKAVKLNSAANGDIVVCSPNAVGQPFVDIEGCYCDQLVGDGQGKLFEIDIDGTHQWVLSLMVGPAMDRMDNDRHPSPLSRPTAEDAGL